MPQIAVVVPTYNRVGTIRRTIASVLSSTADLELAVVDDGSTDDTIAQLNTLGDRRLRLVALPLHGNANVARNAGIAATSAPIIAFLDFGR